MTDDRAVRAFEDVVAVERMAPGLVKVITWSDAYPVDARDAGCNCPDKEYHDAPVCKHEYAAILSDVDRLPSPGIVTDNLDSRAVADGGKPERPDGCECQPGDELACWACYRDGFDQPAEN